MHLKRSTYGSIVVVLMVAAVAAIWSVAQPAAAQGTPPKAGFGLTTTPTPQPGDGPVTKSSSRAVASADNGPDARRASVNAPAATFSYYRLLGTAFNVRTTATTYAYNFNGCIYLTGGSDNRLMAPLLIPDGSIIKYLRIYYIDESVGTNLTAFLTRYQPGVTSEDLITVDSTGASGYGTTLSDEITHTVDLTAWAYTVIIAPNANNVTNSICGIRVAYYAPSIFGVALPLIQKQ